MQHRLIRGACLAWVALAAACAPEPTAPIGRLAIAVAPLSLDGITDASYTLTVVNSGSDTVWTRTVSSAGYGSGDGSLSYVGTCDADASPNTVQLVLDALSDANGALPASSYMNPAPTGDPIALVVDCVADRDAAVTFDLTVARAAQQGFFDISVDLQDVFCSAKLDCIPELLSNASGARDLTAILGFACTAGAGSDTHLYMDDVVVTCAGGQTFAVDPSLGPGNLGPSPDLLYEAAVYRGAEQLGTYNKAYWNVALGLDEASFAALSPCTLTARATVSDGPFAEATTPAGTRWPYVAWDVPLTDAAAQLVCTSHEVGGGDGVAITYGDTAGTAFGYTFDVASATVLPAVDPRLAHSLHYDDTSDTVSVPAGTILGGAATLEAWVWLDPTSPIGMVYNEWVSGLEDKRLSVGPAGARVKLYQADTVLYASPITSEAWHHVATVADGSTVRLYVDGVQVASGPAVADIADSSGLPFVGAIYRDSVVQPSFLGYLDVIRISDTARYTGASFTPPGPDLAPDANTLLLYTFEPEDFYASGADTKVVDHSGNGHDGTLGVGFAAATSPVPPPAPPAAAPSCPATGADSVAAAVFDQTLATVTWSLDNASAYDTYVFRAWGYSTGGDSLEDTRNLVFRDAGGSDVTTGSFGTTYTCTAHSDGTPGTWDTFDPSFLFDGSATYGPQYTSWFEVECVFDAPVVLTAVSSTGYSAYYCDGYRAMLGRAADGTLIPIAAVGGTVQALDWGGVDTYWLTLDARPTCN